jgi:hypothetical protein
MRRILITGSTGNIARTLARPARALPNARLSDIAPMDSARPGEEATRVD